MPIPVVANKLRRLIRLILPVLCTMSSPMFCLSRRISSIYLSTNLDRRPGSHSFCPEAHLEATCMGRSDQRFVSRTNTHDPALASSADSTTPVIGTCSVSPGC